MSIAAGGVAPDFSLAASGGRTVSSAGLKGHPYLLYFYPKADTSGCTKEAQQFEALLGDFGAKKCAVVGVSRDPVKALDKFAGKYGLTFPLASDEAHAVAEKYGTWVEKSMYGRKYMGMERSTFLIDKAGKVAKAWRKVSVTGHAADVLAAAQGLK
jgi:peroxiredoxin Q/BCP